MNMLLNRHILMAIIAAFPALSCVRQTESAQTDIPIAAKWPCFNGCTIFLQGERYGLMTDAGEPVLPAVYKSIEFLDNDYALLARDSDYALSDKKGRIIGHSFSVDSIRLSWPSMIEYVQEKDRQSWELVVRNYELLCVRCKASHGKKVLRQEYNTLELLKNNVLESLQAATGKPTPSQKARLEALSQDYRRAF